ncbi:MAG: hypothetical protein HYU28_10845 [Actinobacteria bacterium]|nr:hypothetical protein [Actinomycetota bacterium]
MNWLDLIGALPWRVGKPDSEANPPSLEVIGLVGLLMVGVLAWDTAPYVLISIALAEALVIGFIVTSAVRRVKRHRRDEEHVERIAERAGLRRAQPGEFNLYALPFPIFRAGEWQGFDHVWVGEWGDDKVWVFDFWNGYELRGQDVEDHFTCAAIELRHADCPKLSVTRENPWSRTWGHLGWRDIEVESDDFNRRFDVSGDDERFAFAFLAPSMIDWLQRTPKQFEFAVEGPWLLCRSRWLPTARWWDLLRMIRDFRGRMPKTIPRLFPDTVRPLAPGGDPSGVPGDRRARPERPREQSQNASGSVQGVRPA